MSRVALAARTGRALRRGLREPRVGALRRTWLPQASVAASPARVELGWPAWAGHRSISSAASRRAALPEHVEMPMPRLVPSMERGVISRWLVEEGACPCPGDLLRVLDVLVGRSMRVCPGMPILCRSRVPAGWN